MSSTLLDLFYLALFVVKCCILIMFVVLCDCFKFWHWQFLRLRHCFIYVFYLNCHSYLMIKVLV